MIPQSESKQILILAPVGKDSTIAAEVLSKAGFSAQSVRDVEDLCARLNDETGAILITEEALNEGNSFLFKQALSRQPAWSNVPILLLTSQRERVFATEQILNFFAASGGFSVLERPFKMITLITSVRVALVNRARQIQARDLLTSREAAVESQRAAIQQRDDFFSIASHELKTPITSLKLQIQMRKRLIHKGDQSALSPEKVVGLLDKTERSLNRLVRLVEDMLDVSRIENGKLSLNREEFDLDGLVQEVLDSFSTDFQAAGGLVQFHFDKDVRGGWDRFRIEQVITNLFTNAIKYGGGHPITIVCRRVGDQAILSVQDQGTGIDPINHQRIFDRFERAVSAGAASGLGLGLFITKQIVNLHGGTIDLESALGQGSCFTVHLPLDAHSAV